MLTRLLERLAADYDYEWDGFLYRAAPQSPSQAAIFYHIAPEGAEFYNAVHNTGIQRYPVPATDNYIVIDFDYIGRPRPKKIGFTTVEEWQPEGSVDDDPAIMIENILPRLRAMGYEVVVINGETGADIPGPSVEVVDIRPLTVTMDNISQTVDPI